MNKKGAGLRDFWISIILIGLFLFALLAFVQQFLTANNPNSGVINSPIFNNTFQQINNSLAGLESPTAKQYTSFQNGSAETPSGLSAFLIIREAFSVPKAMVTFLPNIFAIFTTFIGNQFGSAAIYIVIGVITAIFFGTILLLVIKFIRTGESER